MHGEEGCSRHINICLESKEIHSNFLLGYEEYPTKRVLTAASPISLTTHANIADLPLMTVTLAGVVGSIYGSGVDSGVVVPKAPAAP